MGQEKICMWQSHYQGLQGHSLMFLQIMHEEDFKHVQAFAFCGFPNCVGANGSGHTGVQCGLLRFTNKVLDSQKPLQV